MEKNDVIYNTYLQILKEELVPAMGCTEPIAIAYCAAMARNVLGCLPEKVSVEVSGNIIKNVKSVIVPNTNGLKGIEAAAAAGIIAGNPQKVLEVISEVSSEQKKEMRDYLNRENIEVQPSKGEEILYISIKAFGNSSYSKVIIQGYHTNIVSIEKDGVVLFEAGVSEARKVKVTDRSLLNLKDIYEFAAIVSMEEVKDILDRQIKYNTAIAEEGLKNNYGANIGSVLLKAYGNAVSNRAKAMAAAASDARMGGCELPVIINSGSGNQGITVSLPVIEYARELKVENEKLYRALVLSNLAAIHQKTGIGRLSAYCGAVSAGCGAGAGIAYLKGGDYKTVAHTLVNSLAIASGIICDGAKASCAAKIAMAVDAGIFGYEMYIEGQQFHGGDGIISKGVENTINNIGRLGKVGMKETDKEIIKIMIECK